MSFNQSQDRTEGDAGHKRPLERENESQSFAFVVSQEEVAGEDHRHHDGDANSNKRQRTIEPESPGVVSISSAMDRVFMPNEVLEMSIDKPVVEWWKQKPAIANASLPSIQQANNNSNQATACFICQRPRQQQAQSSDGTNPSNSLLCYFSSTKPCLMSSAPMSLDTNQETFQKCSFCDRQACTCCTRQCERCLQKFCSLCSTTDYSGPLERSFCIDCLAMEHRETEADGNHMNIG